MNQRQKAEAIKNQLIIINKLLKKPENKFCADCKRTSPTWASINLGVFVCINCSGCHREIGVHITKIKSVNLDVWPNDVLQNFQKINNQIANEYWEYNLKKFDFKSIQNDRYKLIQFIRNKYEYKKWADKSRKDPMTLIIQGEFNSEDDDDENLDNERDGNFSDENEDNNRKRNKDKKFYKNEDDNDNDDEENNKDNQENNDNDEINIHKSNNNVFDFRKLTIIKITMIMIMRIIHNLSRLPHK